MSSDAIVILLFTDFEETAQSLDTRRLGKRRVETLQIVRALTGPGYLAGHNVGWLTGHITTLATFVIYGIGALVAPLACVQASPWKRLPGAGMAAGFVERGAPAGQTACSHGTPGCPASTRT